MKWNNVKPDIAAKALGVLTRNWSAFDVLKLLNYTQTSPIVIFDNDVRKTVTEHLKTKNVELGGLLLGNVISTVDLEDGIVAINITKSVASRDFDSTSVSLSMNASVWQTANEQKEDDSFVVGWYHSHPNIGAFFSGIDRKTQNDFFNNDYNLGLVIDPIRSEECWFIGQNSAKLKPSNIVTSLTGVNDGINDFDS